MTRRWLMFFTLLAFTAIAGCSKEEKKISGSEATGETVKVTPETIKENMKNNNGMTR